MTRAIMRLIAIYYYLGCMALCAANIKLGLENISEVFVQRLCSFGSDGARIGLITNHTGINQVGQRNIDILLSRGLRIIYIFSTEHGFDGTMQAGHEVKKTQDTKTNIPIISLYGNGTCKSIMHQRMKNIDVLIFDIQDVGMRHYTYISTLFYTMRTAAKYSKPFIIFDRPNLLGSQMSGPLLSAKIEQLQSCISIAPIPLRYGMTVGELARFFNNHVLKRAAKLHIVKMKNYNRCAGLYNELQKGLSPNIQTKQACYGYSFLGLLGEVRPFSVGLGSEYPFSCLALPEHLGFSKQKWQKMRVMLQKSGIKSIPYHYKSKRNNQFYYGLHMNLSGIDNINSFDVLLNILKFVHNAGIPLRFSDHFDRAVGTSAVQAYVKGKISRDVLAREVDQGLQKFFNKARSSFIYNPLPRLMLMSSGI